MTGTVEPSWLSDADRCRSAFGAGGGLGLWLGGVGLGDGVGVGVGLGVHVLMMTGGVDCAGPGPAGLFVGALDGCGLDGPVLDVLGPE